MRLLTRCSSYISNADSIPEITDMTYAMGKAVANILGIKPKENQGRAQKAQGGNRRERKLKAEIKSRRVLTRLGLSYRICGR